MVKQLLEKLKGLHYGQEYLCIPYELFSRPLHVYFVSNNRVIDEVTKEHLFVGYSPLLILLPVPKEWMSANSRSIYLSFQVEPLAAGSVINMQKGIASLQLKPLHLSLSTTSTYQFFEGLRGRHHFLPLLNRWVIRKANQFYKQQPDNVFLRGNLYEQVQVAYAVPRLISLVTVKQGDRFNVFPTDLHGQAGNDYIISLRTGGKALEQVLESKSLVLSEINALSYKKVYAMGKNHMQASKPGESFEFENEKSHLLHCPIPKGTVNYRELRLQHAFRHGIHTILVFEIINRQIILEGISRLSHVHNAYATWRFHKGCKDAYLMR